MSEFEFYLADSLEKVFPDKKPPIMKEHTVLAILRGEVPAVQLVYRKVKSNPAFAHEFLYEVKGISAAARVRDVEPVQSALPCYEQVDDNYLTTTPGIFPDLLKPRTDNRIIPLTGQYRSLWIDFPDTESLEAGVYRVEIVVSASPVVTLEFGTLYEVPEDERMTYTLSFLLDVSDARLPEQKLLHTEWFHADCLANYYGTEVFDEKHWEIIEKQMGLAGRELGINMLLTPVFTPPVDTAIGGERKTVQLVDISLVGNRYEFRFDRLRRWYGLCKKYGIHYLEIPHLFTQWGAKKTPKILVEENGVMVKKFGWHVAADSPEYQEFLRQFLPALQEELERMGVDRDHVYFHVSDGPALEDMESYGKARNLVADLLDGFHVIDALSEYPFYEKGIVTDPVVSNDCIDLFVQNGASDLWVYYCCAQNYLVPNRFFAMPSARNRVMGVLMYLYRIRGFLHWGYNFYNSMHSKEAVDPFFDTHSSYGYPSGDPFLVYPGKDGEAWSSIRGEVQREGLDDLRALCALEALVGRERVEEIIYDGESGPFTFDHYPVDKEYFFELRRKIAMEMKKFS